MARSQSDDSTPKGIHDSEPLKKTVEDYPERPYSEAITKEYREQLKEAGLEPEQVADAIEGRTDS